MSGYVGESITHVAKNNGIKLGSDCELSEKEFYPLCGACHVIIPEEFQPTLIGPTDIEQETLKALPTLSEK